jgi:hypothetical protein
MSWPIKDIMSWPIKDIDYSPPSGAEFKNVRFHPSQAIHVTCKGEGRNFCSNFWYEELGRRNLGVEGFDILGIVL